jgi:hypothetical protein
MLTDNVAIRFGFGYIPFLGSFTAIPVTISWFPFSSQTSVPASKLELGAGIDYMNCILVPILFGSTLSASSVCFTGIVGYRYQASNGGFVFRIAFTPILFTSSKLSSLVELPTTTNGFEPWVGISFGFAF